MRHEVTQSTKSLAGEVVQLVQETRGWLKTLSDTACAEWDTMRSRFPTEDDLLQGFVSLTEPELEHLRSKLWSFQETLRIELQAFESAVLAPAGFSGTAANDNVVHTFVKNHGGIEARAA